MESNKQTIIAVAFLCLVILAMVGWAIYKKSHEGYVTSDVYQGLRRTVLTLDPASIGLTQTGSNQVWGLLTEIGYPQTVVTLVAIADGSVSLYVSHAGGIIGAGGHEGPRTACESLLRMAPAYLASAQPTNEYPLPHRGGVRFYFLTYDGVFTVEAGEDDLGYNRHPLSPLFHKAHEAIIEVIRVNKGKS